MKTLLKISALSFALASVIGLSGCLVVAAGAGAAGAAYVMGDLEATVNGTPQKVVEASKGVLEEKELRDVHGDATGVDGSASARMASDTKIEITVKRQDEKTCKLSIRVGTFGDEKLSQDLLDRIRAKLPA